MLGDIVPAMMNAKEAAVKAMHDWDRIRTENLEEDQTGLASSVTLLNSGNFNEIRGLVPTFVQTAAGGAAGVVGGTGGGAKGKGKVGVVKGAGKLLNIIPGSKQATSLASSMGLKIPSSDGGYQAEKKVEVMVPVSMFLKLGLAQAIEALRPMLDEKGGLAAELASKTNITMGELANLVCAQSYRNLLVFPE
jgi:hypothetical protein